MEVTRHFVKRPYRTSVEVETGAFCYEPETGGRLVFEFGSIEAARDWCQNAVDCLTVYLESQMLTAQVQAVDNLTAHLEAHGYTAQQEAS